MKPSRFISREHAESAGQGEAFRQYNRDKHKRWRQDNPAAARRLHVKTHLKRQYGLTVAQYDEMFARQNGRCMICRIGLISQTDSTREFKGHPPNEVGRVDHDHKTGQIRGLLCFGCNVGLGKFGDDEKLLLQAAGYLRASATPYGQSSGPREGLSEIEPGDRDLKSSERRGTRRDELSPFFD